MLTVDEIIAHILMMKTLDQDYARAALIEYDRMLPWLGLKKAVKEAMEAQCAT